MMHSRLGVVVAAIAACAQGAYGQEAGGQANAGQAGGGRAALGPTQTDHYQSTYVKLGGTAADGLMYEPVKPGPNARVALLATYDVPTTELANRGYRVLYVRHANRPGEIETPVAGFEETSRGIAWLRKQPGIDRVVLVGWGSGAKEVIFYADIAERGPAGCQGKEVLYPCRTEEVSGLEKPDGVVLFDPGLGSLTQASAVDPAYDGNTRSRLDLDMYAAANGYDAGTGSANYSAQFRKRFFAAQSARNEQVIDNAVARLKILDQGKGAVTVDEPMFVPGAANAGIATDLDRPDGSLLSHTKRPHMLLKADGSRPIVVVQSIRPATGPVGDAAIQKVVSQASRPARPNYTLRYYLANEAVRTTKDFALTEDDVVGVDWKSSNATSPAQATGITVPTLVMTMSCFQFVVQDLCGG